MSKARAGALPTDDCAPSGHRLFEGAHGAMGPLLLRQQIGLDQLARGRVEVAQVAPVLLEPMVFTLFEGSDGGPLADDLGAPFDELRERAPRARTPRRLAAQAKDLLFQLPDALLMRAAALLELGAVGTGAELFDRLPVGLDGGDLPAQELVESVDCLRALIEHGVSPLL